MGDIDTTIKFIELGMKLFPKIEQFQRLYSKRKGYNFIIEELDKNVTVYKNGNGILSEIIKFSVLDPSNFTEFPRRLNIEDAKKGIAFSSLEELKNCNVENRFTQMGFWYSSDTNIISGVNEYYWQDDPSKSGEDKVSKSNPREMKFNFSINNGAHDVKKQHTLRYAFSIPGMFPIKDGFFDTDSAPFEEYKFTSGIRMDYVVKKLKYTISFEKGIELLHAPEFRIIERANGKNIDDGISRTESTDVFYRRFSAETNKPNLNSRIKCNWSVKTQHDCSIKTDKEVQNV